MGRVICSRSTRPASAATFVLSRPPKNRLAFAAERCSEENNSRIRSLYVPQRWREQRKCVFNRFARHATVSEFSCALSTLNFSHSTRRIDSNNIQLYSLYTKNSNYLNAASCEAIYWLGGFKFRDDHSDSAEDDFGRRCMESHCLRRAASADDRANGQK